MSNEDIKTEVATIVNKMLKNEERGDDEIPETTTEEISSGIKGLKGRKTPDEDQINNIIIKREETYTNKKYYKRCDEIETFSQNQLCL